MSLSDDRRSDLIDELDRSVPKEAALVRIDQIHKPMGFVIVGNQTGLRRLGIELLRLADQPSSPSADAAEMSDRRGKHLDYLDAGPYHSILDVCRDDAIAREEPPPPLSPAEARYDALVAFGCTAAGLVAMVAALLCGIIGLVTLGRWLLDWLT